MKITIINGNSNDDDLGFDEYIEGVSTRLKSQNHQVEHILLRDLDIRYCTGCFGCWVKEPGECVVKDDSIQVRKAVIHADLILWASPLVMGFPSALLKKMIDKFIPLLHPYFALVKGETHHLARYEKYPLVGLLLAPESQTTDEDIEIVTEIFRRTALNMKSKLAFSLLTDIPVEQVADTISNATGKKNEWVPTPGRTKGFSVKPAGRLTLINGSPRGKAGNTEIMLQQFEQGFLSTAGRNSEVLYLNRISDMERAAQVFQNSESVLLGFPLYTDAMPGLVKEFIERLQPLRNRGANPALGFLVQSGFPEAAHSRPVEGYLERLAMHLNSPYLGTLVKGGGEGTRIMSEQMNRNLFNTLREIGNTFGNTGKFDEDAIDRLAGRERFPKYIIPIYQLLLKTPVLNKYWNQQLKENGAYEQRFARPYAL